MSEIVNYLNSDDDPEAFARATESLIRRGRLAPFRAALADSLDCDGCRLLLPEYAQAMELALPLASSLAAVERHLAYCDACRADYAALHALSELAEHAPAGPAPAPDLAFLSIAATISPPELWQQAAADQHEFIGEIRILLSQISAWFESLPGGLAAQPVPARAMRDGSPMPPAQRLLLPDPSGEMTFELTILPSGRGAQVDLGVLQANNQQPIGQVAVSLLNERRQRLQRADTNSEGRVAFGELSPGRYRVQVRTRDGQWEMLFALLEAQTG